MNVDTRDFAKKLEQVDCVDHVIHLSARPNDLRPCDDQGIPYPGLVGGALCPCGIKWQLYSGSQGPVVPNDHNECVRSFGIIIKATVRSALGKASLDQKPTKFIIHGFGHAVLDLARV